MSPIMKRAFVGGVVSTIFICTGIYVLGEVSWYEAKVLLSSSLSGINMLGNTVLGVSTFLVLILTVLSLKQGCPVQILACTL